MIVDYMLTKKFQHLLRMTDGGQIQVNKNLLTAEVMSTSAACLRC